MNDVTSDSSMPLSARQCAALLLKEVLDSKRPFDEAFSRMGALQQLQDRDRHFVRLLVLTTLRRLGQIDALLSKMLEKPLTGKSTDVQQCLRLGVTQLVWLKTPPHAAVHAMVETVQALGHERMKGLANAVLKRVVRESEAILAAQDEAVSNVPVWLYSSWVKAYGEQEAHSIAAARLYEPPLDLSVKSDASAWADTLGAELLEGGSLRLRDAGRVDALTGYNEGQWWVQDAAAALPVKMLGDVRGKTVLDLCAAPGGKTAQLAAAGAKVIAVDKSKRRLAVLEENLRRLQLQAELVEADILKWKPESLPDIILLDAPCSATGTIRRHPELVWHRSGQDIAELADLQKRLLHRASAWLKPGGNLLYCVCSLQPEEGEQQAESFLKTHSAFTTVPNRVSWQGLQAAKGALRTHPGQFAQGGGWDGFYAILFAAIK